MHLPDRALLKACKATAMAIEEADHYEDRRDVRRAVIKLRMAIGEWLSKEGHFTSESLYE